MTKYFDAYSYFEIYFATVFSVLALYLLICGSAFLIINRLKKINHPKLLSHAPFKIKSLKNEFKSSLISILLFGFSGVFLAFLYKTKFVIFLDLTSATQLFTEVLVLLLWNELHFFIVHRLFHTKWLYRYHRHHHLEPNISPLATFSFHWSETFTLATVIPLALLWKQFSFEGISLFVVASLILNTIGHSGFELFKNGPTWLQISKRHFDHHKFHKINFGFALSIFDKYLKKSNQKILIIFLLPSFASIEKSEAKAYTNLWLREDSVNEFNFTYSSGSAIRLKNLLAQPYQPNNNNLIKGENLKLPARIKCTDSIKLKGTFLNERGAELSFFIFFSNDNAEEIEISFLNSQTECQLFVEKKKIHIVPEVKIYPTVAHLRQQNTEDFKIINSENESTMLLRDPYEALNARFKILMGYDLSHDEYTKKDPNMFMDFSKAPLLDLIILNTLQLMNDFTGRIILRALAYHSLKGTRVIVMTSKALLLPLEIPYFEKFRAQYPQIQFELYHTDPHPLKPNTWIHQLHQNNHIKALVTYSKSNSELNKLIAGGRNQSEMYFYPQKPDNSNYPTIVQWGQGLYQWGYFDDLDFMISDGELYRSLIQDLLKFNENNFHFFNPNYQSKYLISYPFKSGARSLEKGFENIIDTAQKSLFIISPYLNFTEKIKKSISRAKNRGVNVQFITNLTVENDFMPAVLQPAMHLGTRPLMQKYQILFYKKPSSTLHIKAILVDDSNLILGSVNLNQRSFVHDTELAIHFHNPKLITEFKEMVNTTVTPYLQKIDNSEFPSKSFSEFLIKPFMGFF